MKDFNSSAQAEAQQVAAIVDDLLDLDKQKAPEKQRPEPDADATLASTPQRGRSRRKTISSPNAFSPDARMESLYERGANTLLQGDFSASQSANSLLGQVRPSHQTA